MFLRKHVLELPIHQSVTEQQLDYIGREVTRRVRPAESLLAPFVVPKPSAVEGRSLHA
jgi:hypothetical protein